MGDHHDVRWYPYTVMLSLDNVESRSGGEIRLAGEETIRRDGFQYFSSHAAGVETQFLLLSNPHKAELFQTALRILKLHYSH